MKLGLLELDRYELSDLDLLDRETLLDVCASMVIIYENTGTIRLAHYTVQEYLVKYSVIPEDVDFNIGMTCVIYLSISLSSALARLMFTALPWMRALSLSTRLFTGNFISMTLMKIYRRVSFSNLSRAQETLDFSSKYYSEGGRRI